jgi:hypothetical protein
MNNPWWSTTIMLFMQYIFFRPLNNSNGLNSYKATLDLLMVLSSQETNLWCISKNGSPHGVGIMFFLKHSPNSGRKI